MDNCQLNGNGNANGHVIQMGWAVYWFLVCMNEYQTNAKHRTHKYILHIHSLYQYTIDANVAHTIRGRVKSVCLWVYICIVVILLWPTICSLHSMLNTGQIHTKSFWTIGFDSYFQFKCCGRIASNSSVANLNVSIQYQMDLMYACFSRGLLLQFKVEQHTHLFLQNRNLSCPTPVFSLGSISAFALCMLLEPLKLFYTA